MNRNEFRAVMAAHGENYSDIAELLSCTLATVSLKVNGKNGIGFTQPEIMAIKEHYQLDAVQTEKIFFSE